MAAQPLVSVVVTVYNGETTIARAITSVLAQEYTPLDIVVVDDGSTDLTRAEVERFGTAVRLVSQPNAGAAAARNRAIREARGEFVAFLDSDDEWLPGRVTSAVSVMAADEGVAGTFCRLYRQYPDGSRDIYGEAYHRSRAFAEHLWPSSYVQTSGVTCRRAVLDRVGPIDERLRCHDELDLWIRVTEAGRFVEIPEPLAIFHDTPGSYSKRWDDARSEADFFRVIEKAFERCPDRYSAHRGIIMADAFLHWGIVYVVRGEPGRARPYLRRSLAARPSAAAAMLLAGSFLPTGATRGMARFLKRVLNRGSNGAGAPGGGGR